MNCRILTPAIAASLLWAGIAVAEDDAGHGKDYRTFRAGGETGYGVIADSYTADLVMYLAGNQFMVMEDLITDWLAAHIGI